MARTGRPVGSTHRPVLRSYYTKEELEKFVRDLKKAAETDPTIRKFIAEQIFGKAVQPLSGDENSTPIKVAITGMRIVKG